MFLLSISSGNVNASVVVTWQYPQIYLKIPQEKLHFLCFLSFYQQVFLNMYDLLLPYSMNWLIILWGFFWKNINEKLGKLV